MLKQRDKNIDIAKGLGIFLVVWGHTSATPEWISAFHMPLFFSLAEYSSAQIQIGANF